jgi:hypothetical protein
MKTLQRMPLNLLNLMMLFLFSFPSCFKSRDQFCRHQYSQDKNEIHLVMEDLKMMNSDSGSLHLKDWSISRLRKAQAYIDMIGTHSSMRQVRDELSLIASRWVEFYGYAQRDQRKKMIETLEEIQSRHEKIKNKICGSE